MGDPGMAAHYGDKMRRDLERVEGADQHESAD